MFWRQLKPHGWTVSLNRFQETFLQEIKTISYRDDRVRVARGQMYIDGTRQADGTKSENFRASVECGAPCYTNNRVEMKLRCDHADGQRQDVIVQGKDEASFIQDLRRLMTGNTLAAAANTALEHIWTALNAAWPGAQPTTT